MTDLNRLRSYIMPPPVNDAQGKEVLIDSIYSCRLRATSMQRTQLTAKNVTLSAELVGTDSTGKSIIVPARQCTFVRTPQAGGQVTSLPTASFRSQANNLAVLLFNLNKLRDSISPDTYSKFIEENKRRLALQQGLIDTIENRLEILKAAERSRLQKGIDAINKVMEDQTKDQTKLAETFTAFETSRATLQAVYDAALAKANELEDRYAELENEEGLMFGGARRIKRRRTRKMKRASRKKTRRN